MISNAKLFIQLTLEANNRTTWYNSIGSRAKHTYPINICNDRNGNLERNQQPLQIHVIVVDRSVGANGS